jgi:hypothetical protein
MHVARVVSFEGVSSDRIAEITREMSAGEPPEGMPDAEMLLLHDPDAETSLVLMLFESEDDYRRAHEILDAMPAGDTPGTRTSVAKYQVAHRTAG